MTDHRWTTEPDGQVVGFSVHDWSVVGLEFKEDEMLSLSFRDRTGRRCVVRLERPSELTIEQYWANPIADRLFAWKVEEAPILDWRVVDHGWNALLRGRCGSESDAKKSAQTLIRKCAGQYLVVLSCSYGGCIAAVCNGMSYEFDGGC